jgi:hypothetical protein
MKVILNFFGRLQKINGSLVYIKNKDTKDYEEFNKLIPEGSHIDLYAEVVHEDGSLGQLAKIHSMIRDLSIHTGYTNSEVKLLVKEKAGLCIIRYKEGKELCLIPSFGDCSKEDLSAAIQACYEMGEETGHSLR